MASFSVIGPSVADTEEAELLQCRKALEFAVDTGFADIMVEGDNSVVIKAILSSGTKFSRLRHLYEDVKCMAAGITTLTMGCVHRTTNSVLHSLAQFAKNIDDEIVWMEDSPSVALEAILTVHEDQ